MRRGSRTIVVIGSALLALVALSLIVIATFNWNRLRPFVSDKVSLAIGRPFAINGDLTVDWRRAHGGSWLASWLPWPEFTARDVRIANPDWAAKAQFAHLAALRFRLSPLALLAHRIEVPSLQLVNPSVDLERDKQGRATWIFDLPRETAPSTWRLDIGSVGFDEGTIRLDDEVTRSRLKITVTPLQAAIPYDEIVAQQTRDSRKQTGETGAKTGADAAGTADGQPVKSNKSLTYQFAWNAQGSYQGASLTGQGKTGAVLALQDADKPFPVQADVHIGDNHIALVGTLSNPLHLGALDLRLWLSGSTMASLYPLTGIALPDTPPYATEGHLTAKLGGQGSRYSYKDFHGHVGGSDLAGNLLFVTGGERPRLSGDLNSRLLRFSDLAPLIGGDSNAAKKQRDDGTAQPEGKLLPVEPFRTGRWKSMDADVNFSATRIEHGTMLPIDSLSTHLVLKDGAMYLDPLNFGVAGGHVRSNITLDGSRDPMHGLLKLHARHLKLKQLFPGFAPMRTSFGEINGDAELTAKGNSIAALLGSADGELKLLMNDGAISKTLLETAGLNVGNIIIGKLFGDKTVKINCAATDMSAKNGLFDMRLFVFDTGDAVINVDGTVNLATEKLDLEVQPHTRGLRILSLRSPLYVRGTLKHPDVGVQKGPLLLRGAGAIALGTIAAPAAALIALIAPSHDNEDSGDNTCRAVLQQLRHSGKMAPPAKK
ncbi:MAG TPA: AsmA family protein [Rhodanobacter sp.]|nr:AsmA family protein [Rhodanobacter sp.]